MKRIFALVLALIMVAALVPSALAAPAYPARDINMIIYSAAGGGTDLANRALAAEMAKTLGVNIPASNMEGASGGVAAAFVQGKAHDGYNLLGISEGLFPLAVLNCAPFTYGDWEYFILGGTPGLISVAVDSPYQTVQDVIDAMKANPGKITLANSQVGCIWDIKAALFKQATGVEYQFMAYQGSNPSILACMNGEVDVIITGYGEQSEYLKAGKLRPLAVMEQEGAEIAGVGYVESVVKSVPELDGVIGSVGQSVGFAVPSDVDAEVLDALTEAFKAALESDSVKEYCETKYLTMTGLYGEEAKAAAADMESVFSWLLYDNGVAPKSPEEFNIPRP